MARTRKKGYNTVNKIEEELNFDTAKIIIIFQFKGRRFQNEYCIRGKKH